MTFPTTSAPQVNTEDSGSTNHTVTRPGSSVSGDLLICFAGSWADDMDAHGDWTSLLQADLGTITYGVYAYKDTGSAPASWTFTTPGSRRSATHTYRISGWGGTIATDVDVSSAAFNSSSSAPNFETITAGWGSDDNLWLAYWHQMNNTSAATITGDPANYTKAGPSGFVTTSAGALIVSYRRELAASSETPGDMSLSTAAQWATVGVVVKPGAAAATSYMPPTRRALRTLLTQ